MLKSALLGTEKAPVLEEHELPEAIRTALAQVPVGDKEGRLLTAVALGYVWQRAGQRAPVLSLPVISAAPKEHRPFCSAAAADLLSRFLAHPTHYGVLLRYLLSKMKADRQVLPHEHLVALLDLGQTASARKWLVNLEDVLGERGVWLARQREAWRYALPIDADTAWEEGNAEERQRLWHWMRQQDPKTSVALLRAGWPQAGARERKEWLKWLGAALLPTDLPFVEWAFESLQGGKDADKPVQQEIKALAVEILLGMPESALYREIAAQLPRYIHREKAMMGLQQKNKIALPADGDAFFSANYMVRYLGFDKTSPYVNCTEPEYWFGELVRLVHPQIWESVLDPEWPKILATFEASDAVHERKHWPLLQHLARALAKHRYQSGVAAFLGQYEVNAANFGLLDSLSNEALAKWFLRQPNVEKMGMARNLLGRPGWVWPYALSKHLLQGLLQEDNVYHNAEFAKNMCLNFDLNLIGDLDALSKQNTVNWQQHQLHKSLVMPLLGLLKLRQTIESLYP